MRCFTDESEFPGSLGILAHAQAVFTRLSFPPTKESRGSRLPWGGKNKSVMQSVPVPLFLLRVWHPDYTAYVLT